MSYAFEDVRRNIENAKDPRGSTEALIKGLTDGIDAAVRDATTLDELKASLANLTSDIKAGTNDLALAMNSSPARQSTPITDTMDRVADQAAIDRGIRDGTPIPPKALANKAVINKPDVDNDGKAKNDAKK